MLRLRRDQIEEIRWAAHLLASQATELAETDSETSERCAVAAAAIRSALGEEMGR